MHLTSGSLRVRKSTCLQACCCRSWLHGGGLPMVASTVAKEKCGSEALEEIMGQAGKKALMLN